MLFRQRFLYSTVKLSSVLTADTKVATVKTVYVQFSFLMFCQKLKSLSPVLIFKPFRFLRFFFIYNIFNDSNIYIFLLNSTVAYVLKFMFEMLIA